jgi:hypothetical protein
MARTSVEQSPEVELERIARLRAAGRHEEADKALAEFRKRYPDYRIAPACWSESRKSSLRVQDLEGTAARSARRAERTRPSSRPRRSCRCP